MAFGVGEDSSRLPAVQLDSVDFPAWRDSLVRVAEENGASVDVINLFKALPRGRYETKEEVMRDFSEAARRMAMNLLPDDDGVSRDRRNLGRDAVEGATNGRVRHP